MTKDPVSQWFNAFYEGDEFDPKNIFTSLASKYRNGLPCKHGRLFFGSFHICVRVVFDDGVAWIVRVPLPYRLLQRDKHTEREVAILQFLRVRTSIPVPEIIAYGFGDNQHHELGPFIITVFVHGIPLTDWWKDSRVETAHLNPQIDETIVRKVYRQVAGILLELTSLKFQMIGTLSMTSGEHPTWSIKSSPWTITEHEAERNHGINPRFADAPFQSPHDWLSYVSKHHQQIIESTSGSSQNKDLENLYRFREITARFISGHRGDDFRLFCDDFTAGNILVDKEFNVVGLGDWEFTYAAPYEYQCCLASWLVLSKPHTWTQEDYSLYCKQLGIFLEILEEEETKRIDTRLVIDSSRLSSVIRQGQADGTFWFVSCARSGLFFDELWDRFERFDPVNFGAYSMEVRQYGT